MQNLISNQTKSRDPWSTGVKYDLSKPLFPDPADVAPAAAPVEPTGPQTAAKFIAKMFGPTTEASVQICRFPNDDTETLPFRKIDTRDPAAIESFVKRYDERGSAVYYCVGTLKEGASARNKPNVAEISMLHADIDFKHIDDTRADVERKLKNLKYPPSTMVFSGNGIHAYWLLTESIINPVETGEVDQIEADLRLLCDVVGGDALVCEIARLMRVPGSHNTKESAWKPVEIIHPADFNDDTVLHRYDRGDLQEWLGEQSSVILRKSRERAVTAGETDYFKEYGESHTYRPPIDVKARLDAMMFMGGPVNGIHPTERSVTASMMKAGHPIDDVVEMVLAAAKAAAGQYGLNWNWQREKRKIRKQCETALVKYPPKGGAATTDRKAVIPFPKPTAPPIEIFWHGKSYERAARSWLIDNLIPQTGQGLASGQWGAGKTFAGLDLAASIMTGTPFAGREVGRRGGVVFIAAEGAGEVPVRLEGVVNHKLRPNSAIKGADLDNLPFAWIEECPPLKDEASFERLVAIVSDVAAQMKERFNVDLALIVIDTLSASADFADANDAAEGQRIMNRLNALSRRTGAFVLAVDHFGKVVETGTRGSSTKEAAADVVLAILADRDVSGTVSNTRLAVRKLRGGATGVETPFDLKVVDLGFNETTCIIEWKPDRAPQAKGAGTGSKNPWQALRVLRSALETALADHGEMIRPFGNDGPNVRVVPLRYVRNEFMASYPAEGDTDEQKANAKRRAFQRQVKSARDRSLVCSREIKGDDQIWLVRDDDKSDTHATNRTGL